LPTETTQSASGTWSVSPPISATSATVLIPERSHARTVSMVSVWEFPPASVVTIAPSAPSSPASFAASMAARSLSFALWL
jgi:hypothetical protein